MSVLAAHRYAIGRALAMVRDRPVAFLLGVVLAASALALPLAAASVLWAARPVLAQLQPAPEMSVFVAPRAGAKETEALKGRLAGLPDVTAVTLRPKEAALAQLIKRSGFGGTPPEFGANPLPDVLVARLAGSVSAEAVDALAGQVKGWPSVDAVRTELEWYRKVRAIGRIGLTVVAIFGGLVAAVTVLILAGTVRLHAATKSDEVAVLTLVGATRPFIVRPYAYSAALTLAIAASLASGAVYATHAALGPPLAALTALYGSAFSLPAPEPAHAVAVLIVAILLGWVVGVLGARAAISAA